MLYLNKHRLRTKIFIIFGLLIGFVILSGVYSTMRWNQSAHQKLDQDITSRLAMAHAVFDNELSRFLGVTRVIQERNSKFVELFEYDNTRAINIMLQDVAAVYDVDLLLFLEDGELITTSLSLDSELPENSDYGWTSQATTLALLPTKVLSTFLDDLDPRQDAYYVFMSSVNVHYDVGDVAGQVVLIKILTWEMLNKISHLANAEIIFYDQYKTPVLTSFSNPAVLYPHKGVINHEGEEYFVTHKSIEDDLGQQVAELAIAVATRPFQVEHRQQIISSVLPFFISLIVSMFACCFLNFSIFSKIQLLIGALQKVSEGNLSHRLQIQTKDDDSSKDEINKMAVNFNKMMDKLESSYNELDRYRDKLENVNEKLAREIEVRSDTEIALRAAMKEAEYSNRAKSAFLANMSHEIRTPLTAIIGFGEASLDNDHSPKERLNALHTIVRSGKHLLQVINDILDLSKIEAEKLEIENIEMSPFQILADIDSIASLQASEKGLAFNVNFDFPMPKTIKSDPIRIKQILLNLVSNAIKFTDSGHVNIRVNHDIKNKLMCFAVSDSGIGISEDQLKNIFKPFAQEDASTTRKYGGTGLGLSLSRLLAEKLGGTLEVQSIKGVGSCFTVTISIGSVAVDHYVQNGDEIPVITYTKDPALINNYNHYLSGKVLLAEDNPDNQKLITMYLNKMGATVELAENGQLAVDMAMQNAYDLIYMDMQMPVMGGMQAVKLLRERGYKGPIVALTANAMKEDRETCFNAGCDDFISKPIDRERLYKISSNYLKSEKEVIGPPIVSTLIEEDEAMIDLVNNFITNLPEFIDSLVLALDNQEYAEMRQIAHDIKGVGGNYGFEPLMEVAARLMIELDNKDTRGISRLVEEIIKISQRIYAGINIDRADDQQVVTA